MKIFSGTTLAIIATSLIIVLGVAGYRAVSLFMASPVVAQILKSLAPKIVQTDTQVVIFVNPLIDQSGLGIDQLLDNRSQYLGQPVVVKGAIGEVQEPWGFYITSTDGSSQKILIVTAAEIANQTVKDFSLTGLEYLQVEGTLKEMVQTSEDSLDEVKIENGKYTGQSKKLVIVASKLSPIFLTPDATPSATPATN